MLLLPPPLLLVVMLPWTVPELRLLLDVLVLAQC
jgi:hypothetical protein